jgi:hypothetical protein
VSAELDVERHASLALRYLEEGKGLVDKDPVQASEKLYKAAEETVKALAIRFGLGEVLKRVSERGRWTVTELEKAVSRISESLGEGSTPRGTLRTTCTCGAFTRQSSTSRM